MSSSQPCKIAFAAPTVLIVLCLAAIGFDIGGARAIDNDPNPVRRPIVFHIPPQPLSNALECYARISNREVLYNDALAEGRQSSLVDGVYTPETALEILLSGTGLWADFKDAGFFAVRLVPTQRPDVGRAASQSAEQQRYYGVIQASLRTAFCGTDISLDGSRIAARLWIGQSGRVLQVRTLNSTGNDDLDQRVESVLRRLNLQASPPPSFAQPITIVILPDAAGAEACDSPARTSTRSER